LRLLAVAGPFGLVFLVPLLQDLRRPREALPLLLPAGRRVGHPVRPRGPGLLRQVGGAGLLEQLLTLRQGLLVGQAVAGGTGGEGRAVLGGAGAAGQAELEGPLRDLAVEGDVEPREAVAEVIEATACGPQTAGEPAQGLVLPGVVKPVGRGMMALVGL